MGLFGDLFDSARENMERKRQAESWYRQAKEIVQSANRKYESEQSKTSSLMYETRAAITEHMIFRKNIAKELDSDIVPTMDRFDQFDIDKKAIGSIGKDLGSISRSSEVFMQKTAAFSDTSSFYGNIIGRAPSIKDFFISDEDYYEARSAYEDAKRYRETIRFEQQKLSACRDHLREIKSCMNNEERELNALMGKLRKMSKELNQNMQKSRFTADEIAYLKGIQKISKSIIRLLSTDVADFGDIIWVGSKYKEVLKNIQTINESVPVAPSISDHSAIEKLLRLPVEA